MRGLRCEMADRRATRSPAAAAPPAATAPPGLPELMEGLSREVLRHNPENIYSFCAQHFEKLIQIRDSAMGVQEIATKKIFPGIKQKLKKRIKKNARKREVTTISNVSEDFASNNLSEQEKFSLNESATNAKLKIEHVESTDHIIINDEVKKNRDDKTIENSTDNIGVKLPGDEEKHEHEQKHSDRKSSVDTELQNIECSKSIELLHDSENEIIANEITKNMKHTTHNDIQTVSENTLEIVDNIEINHGDVDNINTSFKTLLADGNKENDSNVFRTNNGSNDVGNIVIEESETRNSNEDNLQNDDVEDLAIIARTTDETKNSNDDSKDHNIKLTELFSTGDDNTHETENKTNITASTLENLSIRDRGFNILDKNYGNSETTDILSTVDSGSNDQNESYYSLPIKDKQIIKDIKEISREAINLSAVEELHAINETSMSVSENIGRRSLDGDKNSEEIRNETNFVNPPKNQNALENDEKCCNTVIDAPDSTIADIKAEESPNLSSVNTEQNDLEILDNSKQNNNDRNIFIESDLFQEKVNDINMVTGKNKNQASMEQFNMTDTYEKAIDKNTDSVSLEALNSVNDSDRETKEEEICNNESDNFSNMLNVDNVMGVMQAMQNKSTQNQETKVMQVESELLINNAELLIVTSNESAVNSENLSIEEIFENKAQGDCFTNVEDSFINQSLSAEPTELKVESLPQHYNQYKEKSNKLSENNSAKNEKPQKVSESMDLETAAITIQKVFRAFLYKSRASSSEDNSENCNSLDEENQNIEIDSVDMAENLEIDELYTEKRRSGILTRASTILQTVNEEKSLSLSTDESLSSAATVIQAHVRGFLVRSRLGSKKNSSSDTVAISDEAMNDDTPRETAKTVLRIDIAKQEQFTSVGDSIDTSVELPPDPLPCPVNLHPLGYDKDARKPLKREDAIQSISPPNNSSLKLSEETSLSMEETTLLEDNLEVSKQEEEEEEKEIIDVHVEDEKNITNENFTDTEEPITDKTETFKEVTIENIETTKQNTAKNDEDSKENTGEHVDTKEIINKSAETVNDHIKFTKQTVDKNVEIEIIDKDVVDTQETAHKKAKETNETVVESVNLEKEMEIENIKATQKKMDKYIVVTEEIMETDTRVVKESIIEVTEKNTEKDITVPKEHVFILNEPMYIIDNSNDKKKQSDENTTKGTAGETFFADIGTISKDKALEEVIVKSSENSKEAIEMIATVRDIDGKNIHTCKEAATEENQSIIENKTQAADGCDEMDVITPRLLHSGEFHDAILPTRVVRKDSSVVREFTAVLVYFIKWQAAS